MRAAARSRNGGVPPTARNARTGELTPAGNALLGALEELGIRHAKSLRYCAARAGDVRRVEESGQHGEQIRTGRDRLRGVLRA